MKYVEQLAESLLYINGIAACSLESNDISFTENCKKIVVRFNVEVKQLLFLVPQYLQNREIEQCDAIVRCNLEKVLRHSCNMRSDFDSLEYTSFWLNLSDDISESPDFCINDEEIELATIFSERCLDIEKKLLGQLWLEHMPDFLSFVQSFCCDKLMSLFPLVNRVNAKLLNLASDVLFDSCKYGEHQYKFVRRGTSYALHDVFLSSHCGLTNLTGAEAIINSINAFLQHSVFPGLVVCKHIHNKSIVNESEEEYISDAAEFLCWKNKSIVI